MEPKLAFQGHRLFPKNSSGQVVSRCSINEYLIFCRDTYFSLHLIQSNQKSNTLMIYSPKTTHKVVIHKVITLSINFSLYTCVVTTHLNRCYEAS